MNTHTRLLPVEQKIIEANSCECRVKVGQIAKELGVSVKLSSIGRGISGKIVKKDGLYTIFVNRHEARTRQRMTIANLLGHYLMHRDVIDETDRGIEKNILYRSGISDKIDNEARRFAYDTLIPAHLLKKILQDDFDFFMSADVIEILAARFQVPIAAIEARLSFLCDTGYLRLSRK